MNQAAVEQGIAFAVERVKGKTKEGPRPVLGPGVGQWAGREFTHLQLPGGSLMQFDLTKLTLGDYRMMRDNYQLNASMNVLAFVLHQIDWAIQCDDPSIKEDIEENLRGVWTQLVRAIAQSFWAGFSPNVIEYRNDPKKGITVIDKFKDLPPEECRVNWQEVPAWAPPGQIAPKVKVYNGFTQTSNPYYSVTQSGLSGRAPYPVDNTLWYPLLMENGDYYGKKLLRPAFPAWFFSTLMHLFSNRYYERFGEPTPVGRAPYDDTVTVDGVEMSGADAMRASLHNLRSRGVVVLPNDRDPQSKEFDYEIKYLESQMRGADFERYMSRLDEEMSLAVFTPVLMFRTADVGSYNLGQQHVKVFMWMLNMLAGDLKLYIQKYVVDRLHDMNYGADAPSATWVYRKLGKDDEATTGQIVMEVIRSGRAIPNLGELGTAMGMTMEEIEVVTEPSPTPSNDSGDDLLPSVEDSETDKPKASAPTVVASKPRNLNPARAVLHGAARRAGQTYRNSKHPDFGYRKQLHVALIKEGCDGQSAKIITDQVYGAVTVFIDNVMPMGLDASTFTERLNLAANVALVDAVA